MASGVRAAASRRSSIPLRPGIRRSVRRTSMVPFRILARASSADAHSVTWWPLWRKASATEMRKSRSSSANRILAMSVGPSGERKQERENGPLPRLGNHVDMASVAARDRFADEEPQAHPLPLLLRGVEGGEE